MKSGPLTRFARIYATAMGAMDFATGLGLVTLPTFTLGLMRVEPPATEAMTWVRFVGAFVGAVGASYLWAALSADGRGLRAMLGTTIIFRSAAGLYTGGAVLTGSLGSAWLAVTVTDLACVVVQSVLLARGVGRDD